MSERILVQFDHALQQWDAGRAQLWLDGEERGTGGQRAQVGFSAAAAAVLPTPLGAVQVCERVDAAGRRSWQIRSADGEADVLARAVQVHRDAARGFYRALPVPPPPRLMRLGWGALLLLLRIPGCASLIARSRSHR